MLLIYKLIITKKQLTYSKIRHMANKPPNSSAIAENTKSLSTTGIVVGNPWYRPIPNHPPVQMANKDCDI